jgi:hypothetical protein
VRDWLCLIWEIEQNYQKVLVQRLRTMNIISPKVVVFISRGNFDREYNNPQVCKTSELHDSSKTQINNSHSYSGRF